MCSFGSWGDGALYSPQPGVAVRSQGDMAGWWFRTQSETALQSSSSMKGSRRTNPRHLQFSLLGSRTLEKSITFLLPLCGVGAPEYHSVTKDTKVSQGQDRPEEPCGWKWGKCQAWPWRGNDWRPEGNKGGPGSWCQRGVIQTTCPSSPALVLQTSLECRWNPPESGGEKKGTQTVSTPWRKGAFS